METINTKFIKLSDRVKNGLYKCQELHKKETTTNKDLRFMARVDNMHKELFEMMDRDYKKGQIKGLVHIIRNGEYCEKPINFN